METGSSRELGGGGAGSCVTGYDPRDPRLRWLWQSLICPLRRDQG